MREDWKTFTRREWALFEPDDLAAFEPDPLTVGRTQYVDAGAVYAHGAAAAAIFRPGAQAAQAAGD
jgi:hypothetical protein